MAGEPKRVSVVVPTYDEIALEPWLDSLAAIIAPMNGEIILVDDSEPAGHSALRALAAVKRDMRLRVLTGNRMGKGDAIRVGMLEANGSAIVQLDADIEEEKLRLIPTFVELIERDGYDLVIAERRSRWEYRSLVRFFLSVVLFLAQRLFIFQSTRFFDTQCGIKAYGRDAGRRLAALQTVRGGMVDIEFLYIAVKNQMRIAQVPITPMRELRPSRLRVLRCLVTDPVALLRIKWNGLRGRYTP